MKTYIKTTLILLIALSLSSCKGFLDVTPSDQGSSTTSMLTLQDATYTVNGMYTIMKYSDYYGTNMLIMGETRADDMRPRVYNSGWWAIHSFDMSPYSNNYFSIWNRCYNVIMRANAIIEGWDQIPNTDMAAKNDILGQAYAVRAICYFDLAKMYGYPYAKDNGGSLGVPLVTHTFDKPADAKIARSTVAQTYQQALSDLETALPLLSKSRRSDRFGYWSAKLLQARIYLYMGNWDAAYNASVEVINNSPHTLVARADYLTYWRKADVPETMLELLVTANSGSDNNVGIDTWFHSLWHLGSNPSGTLVLTTPFVKLFENDPNDIRRDFIRYDSNVQAGVPWLAKYPGNETASSHAVNNIKVLRLTEAYLIAAETGLRTGKADAKSYLDAIKKRANTNANLSYTLTEDEILTERRKEFIGEGHRFFDMMRLGKTINRNYDGNVLINSETHQITWNYHRVVLPISATEIILWGGSILQQNPGYPN